MALELSFDDIKIGPSEKIYTLLLSNAHEMTQKNISGRLEAAKKFIYSPAVFRVFFYRKLLGYTSTI